VSRAPRPTKPNEWHFTPFTDVDDVGNRSYELNWYDPNFHDGVHFDRAQMYRANMEAHIERCKQAGDKVIVNPQESL